MTLRIPKAVLFVALLALLGGVAAGGYFIAQGDAVDVDAVKRTARAQGVEEGRRLAADEQVAADDEALQAAQAESRRAFREGAASVFAGAPFDWKIGSHYIIEVGEGQRGARLGIAQQYEPLEPGFGYYLCTDQVGICRDRLGPG